LQASFVFENVRYTLEIAGFSQGTNPYDRFWSEPQHATSRPHILTHTCTLGRVSGDSLQPVRYFSTREQNASRADVYARLITVCDSTVRVATARWGFPHPPLRVLISV
jgi:hypothetical protein